MSGCPPRPQLPVLCHTIHDPAKLVRPGREMVAQCFYRYLQGMGTECCGWVFFPRNRGRHRLHLFPGPRAHICKATGSLGKETRHLGLAVTHLWVGHGWPCLKYRNRLFSRTAMGQRERAEAVCMCVCLILSFAARRRALLRSNRYQVSQRLISTWAMD